MSTSAVASATTIVGSCHRLGSSSRGKGVLLLNVAISSQAAPEGQFRAFGVLAVEQL
jgi:hypothetical protein